MKPFLIGILFLFNSFALANVVTDAELPLSHCYHWIDSKAGFLTFKYEYAKTHANELTFFTTGGNGAVAGPGLYCAKSPSQSSDYGDRVLRLDFVDDVVILDESTGKKTCGVRGNYYADDSICQKKDWDVKLYRRSPEWFVIQNPGAIANWSTNSDTLANDLKAEVTAVGSSAFESKISQTLKVMATEAATKTIPRVFVNSQARISIADILMKDAKKILSIPAVSVLASLQSMDKNKAAKAQVQWGFITTVLRILRDPSISWSDVEQFLEDGEVKNLFVKTINEQFPAKTAAQKPLENMSVILGLINKNPESFPKEAAAIAVNTYLKSAANLKNKIDLSTLSPAMTELFNSKLKIVLAPATQKQTIATEFHLYNFIIKNKFDASLAQASLSRIKSLLPTVTISTLILSDGEKSYGLGSVNAQAVEACQTHVIANELSGKPLKLSINKNVSIPLGTVDKNTSSELVCGQINLILAQTAQLSKNSDFKVFKITGRIQTVPFVFIVNSTEALEKAATAFMQKTPMSAQVDDIVYKINDEDEKSQRNSRAYWDKTEILNILKNMAKTSGLKSEKNYTYDKKIKSLIKSKKFVLETMIQGVPVSFAVNSADEFNNQCREFTQAYDIGNIDRIDIKINGADYAQRYNKSTYWKIDEACPQIYAVLSPLFTKEYVTSINKTSLMKSPYYFTAKMIDLEIPFGGNNYEDVQKQCLTTIARLGPISVDTILISKAGKDEEKLYNKREYWTTPSEICNVILKSAEIPTAEQVKVLKLNTKYTIEATIQDFKRTFKVNDKKGLTSQCLALLADFKTPVDTIYYSVNASESQKIYNRQDYWKGATEICSELVNQSTLPN